MPAAAPAPLAAPRTFLPLPLLVALFCVLWSSAFAGAKMALAHCPPLTLLSTRLLLAGIIMLALAWAVDGRPRMGRRDVAALVFIGILNNAIYLGLNWTALTFTSSAYTAVLTSCLPLVVALFAGPLLGERMTLVKWAGIGLGLIGVVVVLRSRLAGAHESVEGTLLIGGGMLALSAGTLAFKYFVPRGGVWSGNAIQCLAGGLTLVPVVLLREDFHQVNLTPELFAGLAYLVVAVSIGGYGLWFYLLTRSSATAASSLHFLMPPLGLFFGWLLLGEAVPPLDILGIAPIALGIWLVTRPARPLRL
ncbi:drug/metabolite transporter (DMT)-like permease [Angulomicrobium tetraedrale]|uniref:Drug/metabolite transporter (DMT)-like permease n=1 Tax=Ancylobacter tetraedralis TaxID=217068 RepID=A0A839Z3Y0_9HYPH|nr:DMT family transporter [Ancylobacter tetraedralis]MBB3771394.1 drug/metabolite transporter (DMT)-like permease [Ancylobacter tetraedralis]